MSEYKSYTKKELLEVISDLEFDIEQNECQECGGFGFEGQVDDALEDKVREIEDLKKENEELLDVNEELCKTVSDLEDKISEYEEDDYENECISSDLADLVVRIENLRKK